jgi:hypothetical protein
MVDRRSFKSKKSFVVYFLLNYPNYTKSMAKKGSKVILAAGKVSNSEQEEDYQQEDDQEEDDLDPAPLVVAPTPSVVAPILLLIPPFVTTPGPVVKSASSSTSSKKRSAGSSPAVAADLRQMCEESLSTANNDPGEKVSFGKKKKDFNSVYADTRVQEMELARDRFDWDRSNYESEQQRTREIAASNEVQLKKEVIAEDTRRIELTLAAENKRSIIAEGIKAGRTASEIKEMITILL